MPASHERREGDGMAYKISGTMVTGCDCTGPLCPCNVDATPNTPSGECQGVIVVGVESGNLDDLDLAGTDFALVYTIPGNPSGGNWKAGLVIDDGASDEQAQALERIIQGKEGGMWGEFAPLIGEFFDTQRGSVSVSDGDAPAGSVARVGGRVRLARSSADGLGHVGGMVPGERWTTPKTDHGGATIEVA